MTLPALRNKLGGHGQGTDIVEVPRSIAELAVYLAGAFIVFLAGRMGMPMKCELPIIIEREVKA